MPPGGDAARFGVRFDELAFSDDLGHATPAGRDVAEAARLRLERDGAELSEFKRCDPDARRDEPAELREDPSARPGRALAYGLRGATR